MISRDSQVDRDELLARTDLAALADELLGAHRGAGAQARWPCPSHQPQTGRTPPVSIFTGHRGEQRWHCHACGTGGTAIDLLIAARGLNVRDAFAALTDHTRSRPRIMPSAPATPRPAASVDRAMVQYVARCARLLWTPQGQPARAWLHARGFTDTTLRHHRIGADPGTRVLSRAAGLPRQGHAAILPVHDNGRAVYFQARYLDPDRAGGRKYDNPSARLAPNPRLADFAPPTPARSRAVFVCEGIPDALSISQAGHHAVALLGVGLATHTIAQRLAATYPGGPLRIAFDADPRGIDARDALVDELADLEHPDLATVELPDRVTDLNEWLRLDPNTFAAHLDHAASSSQARDLALDLHR